MIKYLLVFGAIFFSFTQTFSQTVWVQNRYYSNGYPPGIVLDNNGNIFTSTIGGIQKTYPNGVLGWNLIYPDRYNSSTNTGVLVTSIAMDGSGSLFLCGSFNGNNLDLDPGAGTFQKSGQGIFYQKFSNNGDLIWTKTDLSTVAESGGLITADGGGNIIYVGQFNNSGNSIVKIDPNLGSIILNVTLLWEAYMDTITDIITDDNNNIYITGGNFPHVKKFDTNGHLIWHNYFYNFDTPLSGKLAIDRVNQRLYVSFSAKVNDGLIKPMVSTPSGSFPFNRYGYVSYTNQMIAYSSSFSLSGDFLGGQDDGPIFSTSVDLTCTPQGRVFHLIAYGSATQTYYLCNPLTTTGQEIYAIATDGGHLYALGYATSSNVSFGKTCTPSNYQPSIGGFLEKFNVGSSQSIIFNPLAAKCINDPPFSVNGASDSGLPVNYTSSNTSVAQILGNTVTILGSGTTTITASQDGNSTYGSACPVSQLLTVNALPVISVPQTNLCLNSTMQLTPNNGGTWVSSDSTIATISNTGLVRGVAIGNVYFTFKSGSTTCSNSTPPIKINPNNTVGPPSSSPSICINTVLPNITISTSGATGIGSTTGLPAGVNAGWANNTITINGTPSVSGTFNYSIPLTGGCGTVKATGTIIVNPLPTTSAITASATACSNYSPVTYSVTYTVGSTYSWAVTGGTPVSPSTTNSISVKWGNAGTGNVSVTETNSQGCTKTVSLPVTITSTPYFTSPVTIDGVTQTVLDCSVGHITTLGTHQLYASANVGSTTFAISSSVGLANSYTTNTLTWTDKRTDLTYMINATASNGGCQTSICFAFSPTGGGTARYGAPENPMENADLPNVKEMTAYPNPATDKITVAMPAIAEKETPVVLYNIFGEVLLRSTLPTGQWKTDLHVSHLNEGLYVVHVGYGDNVNTVKVMLVRK